MSRLSSSLLVRALGSGAARFHGVLALLALGYLIGGLAMGPPHEAGKLTPSFFPLLIGVLATVLCGLQWWSAVRDTTADAQAQADASSKAVTKEGFVPDRRISPELTLMLATLVYVLVFQWLGYVLSTLVYVLGVMLLFSGLDKWLSKGAIALAITAVGFVLFNQIFNVRLPTLWG
ncbi:tripartite tricarboxylate transporter TctB family protein [Billgrantia pellis]|uniref:Tripartite tricarboxylate transporter TctB family protein n=1 Tax=Billgrantia pellis TaxID=2606936 RepID=A0A7V7G0R3_9GAMM|nr:tripartite tricarboxylate transporter TctB family protein [Halomonas pellis]KAA0013077.1 tripartite tricarboxylate transporter TctB family protein [Halomonas pellis]